MYYNFVINNQIYDLTHLSSPNFYIKMMVLGFPQQFNLAIIALRTKRRMSHCLAEN